MWKIQLKVVLWKNFIIRKRHWFLTLLEALIPVLLFVLIAYGRSQITALSKKQIIDVTYNEKYPISYDNPGFNLEATQFYYSPSDAYFGDIIHRVQEKFQLINNNIQSFENEKKLLEQYARSSNYTVIAIIFNSGPGSANLDYTLRHHKPYNSWKTDKLYQNEYFFQPSVGSTYLWEGFLTVQQALDMSFIEKEKEKQSGQVPEITIEVQEFPYPPYSADSGLSSIFIHYLPLMTLFSFIFVCPAVLKRVVEEKYTGIKELMRMVGMKSWMMWFGWFIYSITPMILSVCLVVLIMKVDLFQAGYPPIEYTNASVLIVFLMLYCVTATINCFFLSTLFHKPTLATLMGLLFWILSYFVPKYIIDGSGNDILFSSSIMLMLLPNMALHFGYTAVSQYEVREIGVQWSNWNTPGGNGSNEVAMSHVCLMLIIDCIIYMILTLYVDGIYPGQYGVPKSILFPFKGFMSYLKRHRSEVANDAESHQLSTVEKGCLSKGIELIKLSKTYGKKKVVQDLSLDIYQDQITVLLGHNGAGKSTTMGMITGMIRKTGGRIFMHNKEIQSSSDVTETIGLCPQYNLFFPDLTVSEHLKFFAMLKGRSCQQAEKDLDELVTLLNLDEKRNHLAHTLSGGMKRKLCLGMAVIGGSKILILDEPSSGMDPQSRRDMWDLLLKWRNQKTILITTHFMEEADALGDWIAIMNEGKLQCYGTPMFLKKKYETGSNLVLLIKESENVDEIVKNIEEELRVFISDIKCKGVNGNEVQFLLPSGSYIKMFEHLESNKELFQIENISFTNTTLEDVFLNSKPDETNEDSKTTNVDGKTKEDDRKIEITSPFAGNSVAHMDVNPKGTDQYILTLRALLYKRYQFIYRKFLSYLIPSLIAIGFLGLCIFLGQGTGSYSSRGGPALKLSLNSYEKTSVFLNSSNDPDILKMVDFYEKSVIEQKSTFKQVDDVSEAIVKEGVSNLPFYQRHMITGAELSARNLRGVNYIEAVALYNNMALHAAPISMNLITNSIAKLVLGDRFSISTTNHPLDNVNAKTTDELSEVQIGLLWLIIMPLGFLFFLGSFIYFPYVELSTNFTQLQFMCGVRPSLYWLTTFVGDVLVYVTFALVMAILSLAWTPFRGLYEFGALYLILVLYGISGIPFSYLFGRKKVFSSAYALFIILGIMLGVLLSVVVLALEESGDESYVSKSRTLRTLFLIFCPQFGLAYSGVSYSKKVIGNFNFNNMDPLKRLSVCSRDDSNACCYGDGPACESYKSYMNVLSPQIYLMLLGSAIFIVANILLDSYLIKKVVNQVVNRFRGHSYEKLESSGATGNTLHVKKLQKSYAGKEVVNDVSLDLKKGECMGILGVNGAGKTTTFRMLTRELVKDKGDININNINIDDSRYLRQLGYCPQNDALNYSLTGRNILTTMAMLRGIEDVTGHDNVVDEFLRVFGLSEIADIPCEQYSGGNRRKLSFAVAVIGFPDFILLDEPTNGVDPLSRRKFWSLINKIKKEKQNSFILTSHSMAECEALCNDLKIMKEGTIRKEGTISELKNEISGFNVMLKLKNVSKLKEQCDLATVPSTLKQERDKVSDWLSLHGTRDETDSSSSSSSEGCDETDGPPIDDPPISENDNNQKLISRNSFLNEYLGTKIAAISNLEDLKNYLIDEYPKGKFTDEHSGLLHFYIESKDKKWSELFKQFDALKEKTDFIEDYSISEASLEQVFLAVANADENSKPII